MQLIITSGIQNSQTKERFLKRLWGSSIRGSYFVNVLSLNHWCFPSFTSQQQDLRTVATHTECQISQLLSRICTHLSSLTVNFRIFIMHVDDTHRSAYTYCVFAFLSTDIFLCQQIACNSFCCLKKQNSTKYKSTQIYSSSLFLSP